MKITPRIQRFLDMFEQAKNLFLGRRTLLDGLENRLSQIVHAGFHPFIGHQKHGLRDIERGKSGIDGKCHDLVGQRHFLIGQPQRSRPKRIPVFSPALNFALSVSAAVTGARTGLKP